MVLKFRISSAALCPKKDVITALDIYCKSVDSGSLTDTNQIKDYIWNRKNYSDEKGHMFFYLLYGQDDNVLGFSEFAYLPKNQILVLDYLCTDQRNHLLFYNFYHMAITEITNELKKSGHFIRYILTELSLKQQDGKLLDIDSNYFRHLLSNENFKLLKYPYYQPPLLEYEKEQEFNLSIKPISNENGTFTLVVIICTFQFVISRFGCHKFTEGIFTVAIDSADNSSARLYIPNLVLSLAIIYYSVHCSR